MRVLLNILILAQLLVSGNYAAGAQNVSKRAARAASSGGTDWADWRGPERDGRSPEKGLPEEWTPGGKGMLWKVPYGGRSAPVVFGNRVYLQTAVGQGETLQERILALDANTGKLQWEYRLNLFHSDVPVHRIAWASPVVDPATGNIYAFTGSGTLFGLSPQGKLLWQRFLNEEFGLITTHGGRTISPIIEGEMVIISGMSFGWGAHARGTHRFMAFDKKNGEGIWMSSPAGRPYDTVYSPAYVADVNGQRLLMEGAADGAVYAVKLNTGEPVWKYEVSKRGINTGVILVSGNALITHSEENLDTSDMGFIAAVDAAATGDIKPPQVRWRVNGFQAGYSSPVFDGQRIYQIDNGANLFAIDPATGKTVWTKKLGTIQRASPVLADGKLYVGTENGRFFILRPRADGCDILDEDSLGTETDREEIYASAAVSRGRIFFVTTAGLYAIGRPAGPVRPGTRALPPASAATGPAAYVQVVPTELLLKPGQAVKFRARLFTASAQLLGESAAAWTLDQLAGSVSADGSYTVPVDARLQAGLVKAAVGGVTGSARVRIVPPLPLEEDFEKLAPNTLPATWVNATNKYAVREVAGRKALVKLSENQNSFFRRARAFFGPSEWADYTIEADVSAISKRRQMGDAGLVAQRFQLTLFGNHQRLELISWQPETARTVAVPFEWKPDTWYRMKLRVENLPEGKVRARGKVWLAGQPEPENWLIERTDALADRQGAAGLFGDAPFDIYFDNLKITPNR